MLEQIEKIAPEAGKNGACFHQLNWSYLGVQYFEHCFVVEVGQDIEHVAVVVGCLFENK
jgi:hypothetical protein